MSTHGVLERLKAGGYYTTDGHFRLVSGKHSDAYVQARLSLMDPDTRDVFVQIAADLVRDTNLSGVAAFTVGGILLAEGLARHLGVPLIVGRKTPQGRVEWVNAEKITADTHLLLVDDVLTTASQLIQGIASLESTDLRSIPEILVAVDRCSSTQDLTFRSQVIPIRSCVKIPLTIYDSSTCPLCKVGIPYKDLSNPEKNFISVLLAQPPQKSEFILKGYDRVYNMQGETQLVDEIKAWKPWLPVLLAGLPMARMEEDSRLIRFVSHITAAAEEHGIASRMLSEIVGQLVSLSSVRVESRTIGCSILVGNSEEVSRILESKARVRLPRGISSERLTSLVPYFDAFLETGYVVLLDPDGNVVDFRRLVLNRARSRMEGIELLRHVTSLSRSIGFVLRRGRSAISVYWKGRLEAVGELSERTGLWEFARPMERIDEVEKLVSGVGTTLVTVVEVARELVAKGHGALFVIGDSKGLNYTSPRVEIEAQKLEELSIDDIVELAKLDGGVIIDQYGTLRHVTVIIQNKGEDNTIPSGQSARGGSRKETARRTSVECPNCATVYVSQNGAIEVYVRGESWSVAEAISGLSRS